MDDRLIKAVFILTKIGSCRFYRIMEPKWESNEISSVITSLVSALASITTEIGDEIPKRVLFGGNEITYSIKGKFVLAIINEGEDNVVINSIIRAFSNIFPEKQDSGYENELRIDDVENIKEKKDNRYIGKFASILNLIVNKRTNKLEIIEDIKTKNKNKNKNKNKENEKDHPLMLKDLDLLIMNETGQPIYLMLTQSLPYDAVLLAAFISAILEMGNNYGLGEITVIEGEKIIIYIEKIKRAFTIVITTNKKEKQAYRKFVGFVSNLCNEWIEEQGTEIEDVFEIREQRENFENMLKIIIDSETWERHIIKQNEIELLDRAVIVR